jgi:hypothetical protein
VRKALHRCFVVLGLVAMAAALLAIPAGIVLASAKSDMAAMANGSGDMPCHKCPDCDKPCPDMGSCLLKCFQPLSQVPAQANVERPTVRDLIAPGPSQERAKVGIPPLLRPPSV